MKITIIIPVYNGEKTILTTLKSCCSQTYEDISILVVNDGSTDKTKEIVEEFQRQDPRVILMSKQNGGLVSARYFGAQAATTDYICFIDADDFFEPNAIRLMVENLNTSHADIVYSNFFVETSKGKLLFFSNNDFSMGYNRLSVIENVLKKKIAPTIWGKIIRRELFVKTSTPLNATIGEDVLFISQLLSYDTKISSINDNILHYVQYENSMVNIKSDKKNVQRLLFLEYLKSIIIEHFNNNANIVNALRVFIMADMFEYLRDGGDIRKAQDLLVYAKGNDSFLSFKEYINVQKLIMIITNYYTPYLGKLYYKMYNIVRNRYRSL